MAIPLKVLTGTVQQLGASDSINVAALQERTTGSGINIGTAVGTGTISVGLSGQLTHILGDLTVDGTFTSVTTGAFNGNVDLGDNGGGTINIGGGLTDIVNLKSNLTVGNSNVKIGSSATDFLKDLWVASAEGATTSGPSNSGYSLKANGTDAGAYSVGVNTSLLTNIGSLTGVKDLMTVIDKMDDAIGAVPKTLDGVINYASPDNNVNIPMANPIVFSDNGNTGADMVTFSRTGASTDSALTVAMGASTTGAGVVVNQASGSGYGVYVNMTDASPSGVAAQVVITGGSAKGFRVDHGGSGQGVYSVMSGTGTAIYAELASASGAANAVQVIGGGGTTGDLVGISQSGTGSGIVMAHTGTGGKGINIDMTGLNTSDVARFNKNPPTDAAGSAVHAVGGANATDPVLLVDAANSHGAKINQTSTAAGARGLWVNSTGTTTGAAGYFDKAPTSSAAGEALFAHSGANATGTTLKVQNLGTGSAFQVLDNAVTVVDVSQFGAVSITANNNGTVGSAVQIVTGAGVSGAGGALTAQTGNGATESAGGGISVISGNGGNTTTNSAGVGGGISFTTGNGGNATGASGSAAKAGSFTLTGGQGGSASATGANGSSGGGFGFTGGNGGSATNSNAGGGGSWEFDGGVGGNASLAGGVGGGGGAGALSTGDGGTSIDSPAGDGGAISIITGAGGSTDTGAGGYPGNLSITLGNAGAATGSGGTVQNGGGFFLTAGTGGTAIDTAGGNGGPVWITAGNAGGGSSGGAGGSVNLTAGTGNNNGAGGALNLLAGNQDGLGSFGSGGAALLRAGDTSNFSGIGGTTSIQAGIGGGGGANGFIDIGTDTSRSPSGMRSGNTTTYPNWKHQGSMWVDGQNSSTQFRVTDQGVNRFVLNTVGSPTSPIIAITPTAAGTNPNQYAAIFSFGDDNADIGGSEVYASEASPEGLITAPPGSICLVRYPSANANDGLWFKSSGTGNTGWSKAGTSTTPTLQQVYNSSSPPSISIGSTALDFYNSTNTVNILDMERTFAGAGDGLTVAMGPGGEAVTGKAIVVSMGSASTGNGLSITSASGATGTSMTVSQASTSGIAAAASLTNSGAGNVLVVSQTSATATGDGIKVTTTAGATGNGITVNQNSNGVALSVNNTGTGDTLKVQNSAVNQIQVTAGGAVNITPSGSALIQPSGGGKAEVLTSTGVVNVGSDAGTGTGGVTSVRNTATGAGTSGALKLYTSAASAANAGGIAISTGTSAPTASAGNVTVNSEAGSISIQSNGQNVAVMSSAGAYSISPLTGQNASIAALGAGQVSATTETGAITIAGVAAAGTGSQLSVATTATTGTAGNVAVGSTASGAAGTAGNVSLTSVTTNATGVAGNILVYSVATAGGTIGGISLKTGTSAPSAPAAGDVVVDATNNITFATATTNRLVFAGSTVTVQAATTLNTTGSGNIDLPNNGSARFKIQGTSVGSTVTAPNLDTLTNGSNADALHTHATVSAADATVVTIGNVGTGGVTAGDVVKLSASDTVQKADADDGESVTIGIVLDTASAGANPVRVVTAGKVTGLTGLTAASRYFLSQTAGALTTTAPTAVGTLARRIGWSITTSTFIVDIGDGFVN